MPQGVGYPSAVLAGPDGMPAVDYQTGGLLTIEELLRRRGLEGYMGNHNLQQMMSRRRQAGAGGGTVDDSGQSVTSTAGQGPTRLSGAGRGTAGSAPAPAPSAAAAPSPEQIGLTPEQVEDLREASMLDMLMPAVGAGAAVGAGYYLSKRIAAINKQRAAQQMPPITPETVKPFTEIVEPFAGNPSTVAGGTEAFGNPDALGNPRAGEMRGGVMYGEAPTPPAGMLSAPAEVLSTPSALMLPDGSVAPAAIAGPVNGPRLTGPSTIYGEAPETAKALVDKKARQRGVVARGEKVQPNDMDAIALRYKPPSTLDAYEVIDALKENKRLPMRQDSRKRAVRRIPRARL